MVTGVDSARRLQPAHLEVELLQTLKRLHHFGLQNVLIDDMGFNECGTDLNSVEAPQIKRCGRRRRLLSEFRLERPVQRTSEIVLVIGLIDR